jgi:D-amino peptidase
MKVFICADLEGVGCVVRGEQTTPGGREYERARRFMTNEVNAAATAAFASGATEVVVADSHNIGLNLIPEELDARVRLVLGGPRPLAMMEGIQAGFDAVFFTGAHARAGTEDAAIPHVFHGRVAFLEMNGRRLGEIGLNAALAGHFGAAVVFVAGDEAACDEAADLVSGVVTARLKQGIGAYAAVSLGPAACCERIAQGVTQAMATIGHIRPFRIQGPVDMRVGFTTASGADRAMRLPGAVRDGGLCVHYQAANVMEAFQTFNVMADVVELTSFI